MVNDNPNGNPRLGGNAHSGLQLMRSAWWRSGVCPPHGAEAQVGEPQKPAEVLLRQDLGDSRLIGVRGHVIVRRVVEVLDETIVARGVVAVELLPEELVGVPGGGEVGPSGMVGSPH